MLGCDDYLRIARQLLNRRVNERWTQLVRHVFPELIPAAELREMDDDGMPPRICGRARSDVLKLTSAHINYITPRGQSWFCFKPKDAGSATSDERDWYGTATRRVRQAIEKSNFYTAQIAMVIDRCATGTGVMLADGSAEGDLVFSHIPAGTYAMAENEYHHVDTLVRKFVWTAHQAAQAWGEENLSPRMQSALAHESRRFSDEFEIWHLVMPRDVVYKGADRVPPLERSWASVYLDPQSKHVLEEGGYYEFPYLVSRFLKYGNQVYGTGVLAGIRDAINDYILMNESLSMAAQRMAIPSILVSGSMASQIDLRGGGMTVLSPTEEQGNLPREWAPAGEYRIGNDLLEKYADEIDEGTFVSVLQVISNVDREMTATEVSARESEKLMTFSQSFTQFTADFAPFMRRIFNVCFRAGLLPDNAPFDVVEVNLAGGIKLKAPEVSYIGLLAKALKRTEYSGLINTIQMGAQFAQMTGSSEALDWVKVGAALRYIADEELVPEECMNSSKEIAAIAQAREQQAMMAQQAQIAAAQATANRDNAQAEQLMSATE